MTGKEDTRIIENLPYRPLSESYKNRFPFTLAAPSFIYPDHVIPNVRMLAPFIDEIELLLFESSPDESLPSRADIKELCGLSQSTGISYHVHLPIDLSITDTDTRRRKQAISRFAGAAGRTGPLEPSTWTLHLPYTGSDSSDASVGRWQELASESVNRLLEKTGIPSRSISVETLDYPPYWLRPVAEDLDLSVCLDIGHLMEHGYPITEAFESLADRISILHLYGGVKEGRGHVGLKSLPSLQAPWVSKILAGFKGTVSLEVFSRKDLEESLEALVGLVNPGA